MKTTDISPDIGAVDNGTSTGNNSNVVIAGGGPTGLLLACELALADVRVTVLERESELPTSSCGMLLHSRAFDALRFRGLGDRFRSPETPIWPRTHFALLWLDLSTLQETDYDLLIPQWRTRQLLAERATELGVDIRYGHEVASVVQDDSHVTVGVRSAHGETSLTCSHLVGCDGENSTVATLAGFEFDELGPSYCGIIADVSINSNGGKNNASSFQAGAFPNGQFGVLPVNPADPTEVRLMTVEFFREPPSPDIPVTVEELKEAVHRITGTDPDIPEPRWITRYGSPTRLAENYRKGRILLAGDSAHSHPPSSGNGLNTALHDAFNLGWKLAATIRGWAPPHLLDTYHDERHPVGRRACIRALAQIPLQHPPRQAEPLRELFADLLKIPEVNRYLVQTVTHVRYPAPPPGQDHPLWGEVFPLDSIETTGLLATGHGVLLDLSDDDDHDGHERHTSHGSHTSNHLPDTSAWADRVDVIRARPVPALDAKILLLRPDGHVAWLDRTGVDQEGLLTALKTWFG